MGWDRDGQNSDIDRRINETAIKAGMMEQVEQLQGRENHCRMGVGRRGILRSTQRHKPAALL